MYMCVYTSAPVYTHVCSRSSLWVSGSQKTLSYKVHYQLIHESKWSLIDKGKGPILIAVKEA